MDGKWNVRPGSFAPPAAARLSVCPSVRLPAAACGSICSYLSLSLSLSLSPCIYIYIYIYMCVCTYRSIHVSIHPRSDDKAFGSSFDSLVGKRFVSCSIDITCFVSMTAFLGTGGSRRGEARRVETDDPEADLCLYIHRYVDRLEAVGLGRIEWKNR
jgi:hypothetical protein